MSRASWIGALVGALGLGLGCTMANPEFDDPRDEVGGSGSDGGDGDGDPSAEGVDAEGTGDGDGDPTTTGDGDGDPTTTGDGDGDPTTTGDGDGDPTTGDGDGDPGCPAGLELCQGECIDTQADPLHCGECGQPCGAGQPICALGSCTTKRYVFVTPGTPGALTGGIVGADLICNDWAADAQLPGTYKAWLSALQIGSPALSFNKNGAFALRNGTIIALSWDDLTDGELLAPIDRDAFGQPIVPTPAESCGLEAAVWTGTSTSGTPQGPDCGGWLVPIGFGEVGSPFATDQQWTASGCEVGCGESLGLYCIQQ